MNKKIGKNNFPKKKCVFPDLTEFDVESATEIQETETTKVSYFHQGIRQTIWLPKSFVNQALP